MSDTQMTDDPMAILLHERRAELVRRNEHNNARIEEIDIWLKAISDGRSTVSRQRKARTTGNSTATDGDKPQPAFLRPDGQGPLPDPMRAEDAA